MSLYLLLLLLPFLSMLFQGALALRGLRSYTLANVAAVVLMVVAGLSVLGLVVPDLYFRLELAWGAPFGWQGLNLHFGADDWGRKACFVVAAVSFLVHWFSLGYLREEDGLHRYYAYLGGFTAAMLGLVLAQNLLALFVCWELVGWFSFLLIGFWYRQGRPPKAATKAFWVNKVGDGGLYVAVGAAFYGAESFDFGQLALSAPFWPAELQWAFGLGIALAIAGKSAQVPLQTWLPDAMAGPTPVSALIHAATMVAAGVFLGIRVLPALSPALLNLLLWMGSLTAFLAALSALYQTDLKRLLAFSTISQLGYMVAALGMGSGSAAFLHLFTHAFFKAGLFLLAGSIIHLQHQALHQGEKQAGRPLSADPQHLALMGGFRKRISPLWPLLLLGGLAGVPLTTGFASKDLILGVFLSRSGFSLQGLLLFGGVLLTAAYALRLYLWVFAGPWRLPAFLNQQARSPFNEAPLSEDITLQMPPWQDWRQKLPVLLLALLSFQLVWFPSGDAGSFWLGLDLPGVPPTIHYWVMGLSLLLVAMGGGTAWLQWRRQSQERLRSPFSGLAGWLGGHYHWDRVVSEWVPGGLRALARGIQVFERRVVDGLVGALGVAGVLLAQAARFLDRHALDGLLHLMVGIFRRGGGATAQVGRGSLQVYFLVALLVGGLVAVLLLL